MSVGDLLRIAALMHSSLANLDKIGGMDGADLPLAEEVNRQFRNRRAQPRARPPPRAGRRLTPCTAATRRSLASRRRPPSRTSGDAQPDTPRTEPARCARAHLRAAALPRNHPSRQGAALITAVPRDDDATLGDRQRIRLREVRENFSEPRPSTCAISRYTPQRTAPIDYSPSKPHRGPATSTPRFDLVALNGSTDSHHAPRGARAAESSHFAHGIIRSTL